MSTNTGAKPELTDITQLTTKYSLIVDTLGGKKKIPLDNPPGIDNLAAFTYGIMVEKYEDTHDSRERVVQYAEPLLDTSALELLQRDCETILETAIVNSTQLKAAKRQLGLMFLNAQRDRARRAMD